VFPPTGAFNAEASGGFQLGVTRLGGLGSVGVAVCTWLLARYGVRGVFMGNKYWRPFLWVAAFAAVFLGGFRSALIGVLAVFFMMFFLEGLHRTRFVLVLTFLGMLAATAIVPLASHLPLTFQRTLAFLPLDLNPEAKNSAEGSSEFRKRMRESVLPQVPKYLLLGKGYGITMEDYQNMGSDTVFRPLDMSQSGLALSGDYHNGILSAIIPFGIWGFMAYVWFMAACMWVLYNNWKHGNPALLPVNMVLFSLSLFEVMSFASFIGGISLCEGVGYWAGRVGLSIALNHGVCRKKSPVAVEQTVLKPSRTLPRLYPGLQR
jgi:O-antigen ligase